MTSLAPPSATEAAPRVSAELLDSQAPTLTPPTANSSPRHEHATLPPEPSSEEPPQVAPEPTPAPPPAPAPNPTDVAVTFLLISGTRKSMHFAPSMTFGRVKEAFWGAWASDGTLDKPPSPSFLRVLHMGKELSDSQTLADAKLPDVATLPAGTVVHISVRPFGPPADDDIVKSKRRSRRILGTSSSAEPATTSDDTHGRSGRCGCIIC